LANHGNIRTRLKSLHKRLGSGLGNGSKIVDEIGFGHSNTSIEDGQGLVLLIGDNVDLELRFSLKNTLVGQTHVADLIAGIGRIGNQFTQKDLLVGIKGIDDETEQLVDLGLKSERFNFGSGRHCKNEKRYDAVG
jgi:hypothetical protein